MKSIYELMNEIDDEESLMYATLPLHEDVSRNNPYLRLALTIFENDEAAEGIIVSVRPQGSKEHIKVCKTYNNDQELQNIVKQLTSKYGKLSDVSTIHDRTLINAYKQEVSKMDSNMSKQNQEEIDGKFNELLNKALSNQKLNYVDVVDTITEEKWFELYKKYIPKTIPSDTEEQKRIISLFIEGIKQLMNKNGNTDITSNQSSNVSQATVQKFTQICINIGKQLFFKDNENKIKKINPKKYSEINTEHLDKVYISRTGKEGTDLATVLANLKGKSLIECIKEMDI